MKHLEAKLVKIFKRPFESGDPSLSMPTEIHLYDDGKALACHADIGDFAYASLADIEEAYWIETEALDRR